MPLHGRHAGLSSCMAHNTSERVGEPSRCALRANSFVSGIALPSFCRLRRADHGISLRRIHHRVSVSFERPAGRMGFNFTSTHSALGILFQAQREQIQDCPDITLGLPSLARFAPLFSIRTVYLRRKAPLPTVFTACSLIRLTLPHSRWPTRI